MKLDNLSNSFIKVVTFLISRQVADNKYRSKEASQYIKHSIKAEIYSQNSIIYFITFSQLFLFIN